MRTGTSAEIEQGCTRQLAETTEKDAIGKLWAAQDRQKYVYATIYRTKDGMTVEQQIAAVLDRPDYHHKSSR